MKKMGTQPERPVAGETWIRRSDREEILIDTVRRRGRLGVMVEFHTTLFLYSYEYSLNKFLRNFRKVNATEPRGE